MKLLTFAYRSALGLIPREFRRRYADEMLDTYRERVSGAEPWRTGVVEIADVLVTAVRLHARQPVHVMVGGVAVTSVFMLFAYQQGGAQVDFRASDPAGEFTLSVRRGKPVAATMDGVSMPLSRVHQSGDSIRFLQTDGRVLLTVAYDRESSSIEWEARAGEQ